MITPSPTTKIDPGLARGVYAGEVGAGGTGTIIFSVPDTSYELHLSLMGNVPPIGKRLIGTIRAQAQRMDVVRTGGRYIEPVMGRPRRVQGVVVRVENGAVVVEAGVPIHVTPTDPRQTAAQFQPGDFVSFDVKDGATITRA